MGARVSMFDFHLHLSSGIRQVTGQILQSFRPNSIHLMASSQIGVQYELGWNEMAVNERAVSEKMR